MLDAYAKSSDRVAQRPTRAIALTEILPATPSNLLPLARSAQLTSLPLCLLVPLRDLLLDRGERRVRRRSSRSRFVSLLGHLRPLLTAPYENWPHDQCESETSSGGDSLSTVAVPTSGERPVS